MRFPYGSGNWYNAQSYGKKTDYGYHELPFLKFGIFPIIRRVVDTHVTSIANGFKVELAGIPPIGITVMNQEWSNLSLSKMLFRANTTKLTLITSVFLIQRSSVFIVTIFTSSLVNFFKRCFNIVNSFIREHLTIIRTIFGHFASIYFIAWRNKWFLTIKTLENVIPSTPRTTRFFSKYLFNQIIHTTQLYGLHEGVSI